ncbi:MAG: putative signal transducing protein [Planctomycetota bacterium]
MPDKLVTIATFSALVEASMARDQLDAEGVRAVLADAETVGMAWHLTGAFGGIKLQVMAADADRAISILRADDTTSSSDAESWQDATGEDFARESDRAYEDEYEYPTNELVDRAFRAALLGVLFLPLQFYSVWLLLRIRRDYEPLSSADRRRILITVILDAWMIVLFAAFFLTRSFRP